LPHCFYSLNLASQLLDHINSRMQTLLKPSRFEASSVNVSDEWIFWKRCFENFLSVLPTADNTEANKLLLLTSHLSPTVYKLISSCTSYAAAISKLDSTYVKKKNLIFARYLLSTRLQQSGQSIDDFLLSLEELAKECDFQAVDAEKYRDESIRGSFIAGLSSSTIRERLLENSELSLQQALDQARALESAHRNANSYANASSSLNAVDDLKISPLKVDYVQDDIHNAAITKSKTNFSCYFCGGSRHERAKCPARSSQCNTCGKMGHFSRVCRSNRTHLSTICTTNPTLAVTKNDQISIARSSMDVYLGHSKFRALVDTGSTSSFIQKSIVQSMSLKTVPCSMNVFLASNSNQMHILNKCTVTLSTKTREYRNVELLIIENLCSDIILGRDFMQRHSSVTFPFEGDGNLVVNSLTAMKIDPPKIFGHLEQNIRPIATPTRRYSAEEKQIIANEVKQLLENDIIEVSESSWRAQVVIVRQPDKNRMVIDYSRTINKFTEQDAFPLPRMDDLAEKIAKHKFYTTIDLKSAYHQVPLLESDRIFTAFEANGKLYQFKRLPFGLTNAVACFQRILSGIIADNSLENTFNYLDDCIVCGSTEAEHDANLKLFQEVIQRYNISINPNKCHFKQTTINYLGYQISHGCLKPDPDRFEPLMKMKPPSTQRELQRVLGIFSYYAKWVKDFSKIVQPLLSNVFPLSIDALSAFESIKKRIKDACLAPILEEVPFVLETDASDTTLAGTLLQNDRPVAFFSRSLSKSERHHSSIEKEAAAIIESVRKWRHFLRNKSFTLITDQQAVSFIFDHKKSGRTKNDKILRWRLELSTFCYDIQYRPGRENLSSDAISRLCSLYSLENLKQLHQKLCHPGVRRLTHYVKENNLPFSINDIKQICESCCSCRELKPRFYTTPRSKLISATKPFERLSIDFMGPKSSITTRKYILTVIDEYSRFPFAFPCKDQTTTEVINHLHHLFSIFGYPSKIHSDRGAQFESEEFRKFLNMHGIIHTRTTPYHPIGNGQCERFNGVIWRGVKLILHERHLPESHWEDVLQVVLDSQRSLLCTSTNKTPHELMFQHSRQGNPSFSLPDWLQTKGPVLLRRFVRHSKSDPLVDRVELIDANPFYSQIKYPSGRIDTVSTKDLAPSETKDGNPLLSQQEETGIGDTGTDCDSRDCRQTDLQCSSPVAETQAVTSRYPQRERKPVDRFF